jgi:hypothetical protein
MLWTLTKGSQEFSVEPKTLRAGLEGTGVQVERHKKYTTKQITTALFGDSERERARLTHAQADREEQKNRERSGELVELEKVANTFRECMLAIRQRLLALANEACAHCNPADPQLAREALQRWIDEALAMIRKELPR